MWNYEKRLEYPINIKRTDAAMAKAIISQFGGPDGRPELRCVISPNDLPCLTVLLWVSSQI